MHGDRFRMVLRCKLDAINAVLAAVGYNFSLLLNWFRNILCLIAAMLCAFPAAIPAACHVKPS